MVDSRRPGEGLGDLVVVGLWTLVTVVVVATGLGSDLDGSGSLVRVLFAGTYLLVVPGYAFVAALFPRASELSLLERGAFGVGASLALVGLLGIPLDATPWGVRVRTVLVAQALVVAVLLVLAAVRRGRLDPVARAAPLDEVRAAIATAWARRNAIGGGSRLVQVAIIVALVASVGATAYTVATPLPSERYTELYVLGPDGTIEGVPSNATVGEAVELTVGVTNHEFEPETYGIQAQVQIREGTGGGGVHWTTTRQLGHTETRETTKAFTVPDGAERVRLQILVFRGEPPGRLVDADRAYRSIGVVLTVPDA
jgi:uncharacterized membrane protein